MQLLPTEIHDWVNPKDFNLHFFSNNSSIYCFLKVNFDSFDEMHVLHNLYNCMTCRRISITSQKMIILLLVKTTTLFKLILNLDNNI